MTSNEYVEALYRLLFNRPPEPEGLHHWSELIAKGWNPMDVLQAFLGSEEYRRRNGESEPESLRTAVIQGAKHMLRGRRLFIVDVGAQILDWEDHIYQPLVTSNVSCEVLGFEPLAHRLRERAPIRKRTLASHCCRTLSVMAGRILCTLTTMTERPPCIR